MNCFTDAGRLLVVDDEVSMCEMLETALELRGFEVEWCQSAPAALKKIANGTAESVLTDVKMPGTSGLQLCQQIASLRPDIPAVVMTAFGSMETAVAAMRAGAYDFVTKPIEMDLLSLTMSRAVRHHRLQRQVRVLSEAVDKQHHFGEIIGDSPVMQSLYHQLERIAAADASVLITGESGTGKELVARSLHRQSPRADRPFVAVNCAALSETLLESELFGHVRGAFTDARTERRGLFIEADGGTLLLDEMGDMPLSMQVKLLRALEESRLRPVGSDREIAFDVRVLAATNRDLETAVAEGRFREDLYYRINVIQISLPPLRSRGTDILRLAHAFVERFAEKSQRPVHGITENAAEKLLGYSWPGNIRELRNVIERAVALTRFDKIDVQDLPEKIRNYQPRAVFLGGDDPTELATMEEVERRYIAHVLDCVGHNKTQAAKILGLDRKTLYRKLKQDEDD